MKEYQSYFEANKVYWDNRAKYHVESKFYDVPAIKAGATSLNKIELNEMPSLEGKDVLHMQCHFGLDSISFCRMGANVTAVDLSSQSIFEAKKLANELGLSINFIESNVLSMDEVLDKQEFDFIYTSYGSICWLPDLDLWAKQLSKHLKSGGHFYMAEFHPTLWMFDHQKKSIAYKYFGHDEPYMEESLGSYAEADAPIKNKEYFWSHSIGEVCTSLTGQGLKIDFLNEYDYSPYNCFENMEMRKKDEFIYQINGNLLPMIFSIQCSKA